VCPELQLEGSFHHHSAGFILFRHGMRLRMIVVRQPGERRYLASCMDPNSRKGVAKRSSSRPRQSAALIGLQGETR
jgi:hypothetical protein